MPVSYLISSYNKRQYLGEVLTTAHSELQQTGGEIIVIDDGSIDDSWSIIERYSRQDARISVYQQQNKGIFQVTNRLISLSTQPWIRFVDCDDPLIPGSTHAMKRLGEDLSADYVFGQMKPYGPNNPYNPKSLTADYKRCPASVLDDPLLHAIVGFNHVPSAALLRQSAVDSCIQLPEDLVSCQDFALALQVFAKGRVAQLMAPVCWQLVGVPNRLSSREELTYQQTIEIMKRFGRYGFNHKYKRIAANKVLSRSLRWMKQRRLLRQQPKIYAALYMAYVRNKLGFHSNWDTTMNQAAAPLELVVRPILRGGKVY